MRGVILAGGEGTRLRDMSGGRNKHVVEVGGQPMISYPLQTLAEWGCKDVVIVTSPKSLDDISQVVEDTGSSGMSVDYAIQEKPLGTANALQQAKDMVDEVFPLICGDVFIDPTPQPETLERPTLFFTDFEFGNRHTVYVPSTSESPATLVEKPDPKLNLGNRAVMFYFYDPDVFEVIPKISESARGELELEDLHRFYLDKYGEEVMQEHEGFVGDMGTPDGLARVEGFLKTKMS
jgi:glucose-1-phosphate thymidylyltransferase